MKKVLNAEYQLVFFTAELLLKNSKWRHLFRTPAYVERLRAFVIDEAHTLKMWLVLYNRLLNL
jgi:superfamily II DNA helicase RecQ